MEGEEYGCNLSYCAMHVSTTFKPVGSGYRNQ